jgi:hypothetical protein
MMKKTLLALIMIASCSGAFAQLDLKASVGFNLARFDSKPVFGTDTLSTNGKAGYQFGASLAIGRKLYVEPGVFYAQLAQEFTSQNIELEDPVFTYRTNYLRIPVNLGFQFIGSTTSFAGLKIFVGPSLFIPLSVKDNNYPITKNEVKSPQFDFSVGAGLNIWLFFLDVSYGWGLTPQFKDDPIAAKMQAFYANLGFRFKLKKEAEE